jgi:hypothetical protein
MRRRLLSAALLLLLGASCSEGHDELKMGDMTAVDDMAESSMDDMSMPDMMVLSCGEIVRCIVTCGLTNLTCDQMCFTGADATSIQEAGALALCAATNCLNLDGGTGNQLQIFMCLTQKCQSQVSMCPNLFG